MQFLLPVALSYSVSDNSREGVELLFILSRKNDRHFDVTIVQTDPHTGLRHHAVNPAVASPQIHYRTCLVLHDVEKKNALDDVFWMATFNLTCHKHKGGPTPATQHSPSPLPSPAAALT